MSVGIMNPLCTYLEMFITSTAMKPVAHTTKTKNSQIYNAKIHSFAGCFSTFFDTALYNCSFFLIICISLPSHILYFSQIFNRLARSKFMSLLPRFNAISSKLSCVMIALNVALTILNTLRFP